MEAPERHKHTCLRCGYTWLSKLEHPKRCTFCKSPYYNKPRTRGLIKEYDSLVKGRAKRKLAEGYA
jgi:hypothetical protein